MTERPTLPVIRKLEIVRHPAGNGSPANPSGWHLNGPPDLWLRINGTHYVRMRGVGASRSQVKLSKKLYECLIELGMEPDTLDVAERED